MTHIVKTAGRFIAGITLSLCALIMLFVILAHLVLIVGLNMIGGEKAASFMQDQINPLLAQSGYNIALSRLSYDPVRGLNLSGLSVQDETGPFLTADGLSVSVAFARLPIRQLEVQVRGRTWRLDRMPVSRGKADPTPEPASLTMPALYFEKIILRDLSIDSLVLGKGIAGQDYRFSPILHARLVPGVESFDFVLELKPGLDGTISGVLAPDAVTVEGAFNPAAMDLVLRDARITSPAYRLGVRGNGTFKEGGLIRFSVTGDYIDLADLTSGSFESLKAEASISGPARGPALELNATAIPGMLREQGLESVVFTLKTADITEGMTGTAHLSTIFRQYPVTLDAGLSYDADKRQIHISEITGAAPSLTVTGDLRYSVETALVDGALKIDASDLSHYTGLAGVDLSGAVKGRIAFSGSGTHQTAQANAALANIAYDTIHVQAANIQAGFPALPNPWPESASVDLSGLAMAPDMEMKTLKLSLGAAGDKIYRLTIDGQGTMGHSVGIKGSAHLSGLDQSIPDISDIDMRVRSGDSSVTVAGRFSAAALDLVAKAESIAGRDLPGGGALSNLRLSGQVAMTGLPAQPQTRADITITGIDLAKNHSGAAVRIQAHHDGKTITATLSGSGQGIRSLSGEGGFPLGLSIMPFAFGFDDGAALTGTVQADVDLGALAPLLLPPGLIVDGDLRLDGRAGGILRAPDLSGTLRLGNGRIEDKANGITLENLTTEADVATGGLVIKSLSASDGANGRLNGRGSLAFGPSLQTDVALQMTSFNIPKTGLANGTINADLVLKGSAESMDLSGSVTVTDMNIMIPEQFQSNIPSLNIVDPDAGRKASSTDKISLNVQIDAPNQIFVRGWGLDAEFGGAIEITGTAAAPQMNGTLASRRGRLDQFGKRFSLKRANLRFQGSVPPSPYLDVEATTPAGDIDASILLTGPVKEPSFSFSSVPALPEDEVLARILFGKDITNITPFQAVQLAQTIQRLSGHGGISSFDPIGSLRTATGLDDVFVETGDSGQTSVGAGKYLTDKVYLRMEAGNVENSGAATVQIELTPSINIESRVGQDAKAGAGILWKRDY